MLPTELFRFVEHTIHSIAQNDDVPRDKVSAVYALLTHFLIAVSEHEKLHFTTLFSRISYFTSKHRIGRTLTTVLHQFRIDAERVLQMSPRSSDEIDETIWKNGAYALVRIASEVMHEPLSAASAALFDESIPKLREQGSRVGFISELRMIATEIDVTENHLVGHLEQDGQSVRLAYNVPGRSDLFCENVIKARRLMGLPLTVSAVNVEVDADGVLVPGILVIEPDYLVDVTAVAECYRDTGGDSRLHLLSKLLPKEVTAPILAGHIANFFLDELVHNPHVTFQELLPRIFTLNPTAFSTLSDSEVFALVKKVEAHFEVLRGVMSKDFPNLNIDPSTSYIEPSFYAPTFGLQGRLDLFHVRDEKNADIVELKSAKPFMANTYGLSSSHYTQTLLYDLMIRAVYEFSFKPTNYILYSSQAMDPLRYAPPVTAIQREAIRLRNEIVLIERALTLEHGPGLIHKITTDAFPDAKGFIARNVERVQKVIAGLSPLEQKYLKIFIRFIANEHYLAKLGMHGSDRVNGLASLWLDPVAVKEERFAILRALTFDDVTSYEDAVLTFSRHQETNNLANFRIGDIAVLYPGTQEGADDILRSQVYKCSIIGLSHTSVEIRLRNKQVNYEDIRGHTLWNIEHDLLDSSFRNMYGALFTFAEYPEARRALFLGLQAPAQPPDDHVPDTELAGHPGETLTAILRAPDYFLLWGPPGTGKTSVMLHHLVRHYFLHTDKRILLMAYTNRAVDEMCQAIDSVAPDIRDRYIRIGSRVATHSDYREQLLSTRIAGVETRRGLIELLRSQRIVVTTVSSLAGRQEVFRLLQIDVAIVDEASQILEPLLAGMLPRIRKWVLIGDHKQLPAVVAQQEKATKIEHAGLNGIHLRDTRTSYFERMYTLCRERGWTWAYGRLFEQGRMHTDIMRFPGRVFYEDKLRAIRQLPNGRDLYTPLAVASPDAEDYLHEALRKHRMIFIPSKSSIENQWSKTHDHEADIVCQIISRLQTLHTGNGTEPHIGVITPFRAQIANIRDRMVRTGLDPTHFTIDTVERYQGSARDIIILSLCVNHPGQLDKIVSLSEEGVDRKLNVAITRAREQFIFTASPEMLHNNTLYNELIAECHTVEVR